MTVRVNSPAASGIPQAVPFLRAARGRQTNTHLTHNSHTPRWTTYRRKMVIHNHLLRLIVVFAVYLMGLLCSQLALLCFCEFRPQIVFKSFLAAQSLQSPLSVLSVPANYKSWEWVAWEFLIIVIMLLYWNWTETEIHLREAAPHNSICVESCVDCSTRRYFPPWPWKIYAPTRFSGAAFYDYFLFIFVEILNPHAFRFLSLPTACPFLLLVYYYPFAGTFLWVKPDAAYLCDNAVGTRNWKCQQFQQGRDDAEAESEAEAIAFIAKPTRTASASNRHFIHK